MPVIYNTPSGSDVDKLKKWFDLNSNVDESKEISDVVEYNHTDSYSTIPLSKMGILGLPYQFNSDADVTNKRIYYGSKGSEYIGRVYEEKILSNMPLVFFEIGKPLFMGSHKDTSIGNYLLTELLQTADAVTSIGDEKEGLLTNTNRLRYYTFEDDFNNYANYVNSMCRFVAVKMGIGGIKNEATGFKYRAFDIRNIRKDVITCKEVAMNYYVSLYVDAQASAISENISNTTGDSALSSTIKTSGQLAKEVSFLLDADGGDLSDEVMKSFSSALESLAGNLSGSGLSGVLSKISSSGATVVSGANVMFPQIWQDSSFTKSYSLSATFTTPYGDPESIFMDVYVPLFCILGMAMPRQKTNAGYGSPFIIKAHAKGFFNCDMGMIESVEIKRGGQSNQDWTDELLPTTINVTINIKDLYPAIVATQASALGYLFVGNTGLIEYLNTTAGINLLAVRPWQNMLESMEVVTGNEETIFTDMQHGINKVILDTIRNVSNKFFS